MKILFVIDSLQGGGAARVTTVLANELCALGHDLSIATNLSTRKCNYYVAERIKLHNIYNPKYSRSHKLVKFFSHVYDLRTLLKYETPDVIIGQQEYGTLYAKLASLFMGVPIIGHRHNTFKILGLSKMQRLIYNSVNMTVVLHNTDVKFVNNKLKRVLAIYNPCTFDLKEYAQKSKSKTVVVVGNTKRYLDKGLDLILDIWRRVINDHLDWKLIIVGGGSLENEIMLQNTCEHMGLSNSVRFTGFVNNVDEYLMNASIFAMPSRVEGFPMVLNEAVSQGCACVAFSLSGVLEELYPANAVVSVPDGDCNLFANSLCKLMDDIDIRSDYSRNAQTHLRRYNPKIIAQQWELLIKKVTNIES